MGEGITLFVFYVTNCDCVEKKKNKSQMQELE